MSDNPHPLYRQKACELCASGMPILKHSGMHYGTIGYVTGPWKCTAPTESAYIAELEAKVAELERDQVAEIARLRKQVEYWKSEYETWFNGANLRQVELDRMRKALEEIDYELRCAPDSRNLWKSVDFLRDIIKRALNPQPAQQETICGFPVVINNKLASPEDKGQSVVFGPVPQEEK